MLDALAAIVTVLIPVLIAAVTVPPPSGLVDLGDERYALVVDKESEKLFLYEAREGEAPHLVRDFNATTGRSGGNKLKVGDLKTPEGVYFPTRVMEDAELPGEYGVRAFVLDYPNVYDALSGKTGSGIWLHATNEPLKALSAQATRGCVVVTNRDIQELTSYIEPGRTPILIEERVPRAGDGEREAARERIAGFVERWRKAWESWDVATYSSCYGARFSSSGMDRRAWIERKRALAATSGATRIALGRPLILVHNQEAVVSFSQDFSSATQADYGHKTLYLERGADAYQIVAERWEPLARSQPVLVAQAVSPQALALAGLPPPGASARETAPVPAAERISSARGFEIVLDEFSAVRDGGELRVSFRLGREPQDGRISSGRLVVVAASEAEAEAAAYPPVALDGSWPVRPGEGDWFSVRRFKIVQARIGQLPRGAEPRLVRVLVYDLERKLILREDHALTGDGEGASR